MGVSYTLFTTDDRKLVDLDKDAYIWAENIPDVLYMVQNYMQWGHKVLMCSDWGDDAEHYGFDKYTELNADKEVYSNFTFIKSEKFENEYEVITLVRNTRRKSHRTENWQEVVKDKLKGLCGVEFHDRYKKLEEYKTESDWERHQ